MKSRNFKLVSQLVFGRGTFDQLDDMLSEKRTSPDGAMVFVVDDVFQNRTLADRLPLHASDLLLWVNVDDEPKTRYVDALTAEVKAKSAGAANPVEGVIGIGGGSTLDLAKAISLMLTNPGSSSDYQGWDLVRHPAVYHVGVPTLSGTGSEVSRTTVLTGPVKKLGINSNYTAFDQILLDPELLAGAAAEQRFYTGMDCYIHCIESLTGTYLNAFSKAYGEKALELCRDVFLNGGPEADDNLMMASYMGGMSIVYSQVGICHALSYGLSFVLGVHHGIGNCIVFDNLGEFYPKEVEEFRRMAAAHGVSLPRGLVSNCTDAQIETMIDVAMTLVPLWENALGADWRETMPRQRMADLYKQM